MMVKYSHSPILFHLKIIKFASISVKKYSSVDNMLNNKTN